MPTCVRAHGCRRFGRVRHPDGRFRLSRERRVSGSPTRTHGTRGQSANLAPQRPLAVGFAKHWPDHGHLQVLLVGRMPVREDKGYDYTGSGRCHGHLPFLLVGRMPVCEAKVRGYAYSGSDRSAASSAAAAAGHLQDLLVRGMPLRYDTGGITDLHFLLVGRMPMSAPVVTVRRPLALVSLYRCYATVPVFWKLCSLGK
eukprot:TRINITY_DN9332_c0_g1_i12.p2 TRINITY_DN9332_c0_g1~~TRINITY_DN9332_c0_g1_i12.p2  ORF type:complete len:199 (-),score=9.77 TRINITY_DN9332_c0_g1_i12:995-1591(-)